MALQQLNQVYDKNMLLVIVNDIMHHVQLHHMVHELLIHHNQIDFLIEIEILLLHLQFDQMLGKYNLKKIINWIIIMSHK
jgi:hypothetical protein